MTSPQYSAQPAVQKTSGLDFSTIGNELSYWLQHIGKYFAGGFANSGENGVDITLPQDTPIYAFTSGTVKGAGYYGGGGVVSIEAQPGQVWYYQHLDQNVVQAGDTIQAGQLIGYSGGQNSGGNHPATPNYSSWPHIEVGINAPWSGIWGGGEGPNVNPLPYLQQIAPGVLQYATKTGSNSSSGGGNVTVSIPGLSGLGDFFSTLKSWFADYRPLKFIAGIGLMFLSVVVIFLPDIAAGAADAAGLPEAGAAVQAAANRNRGAGGAVGGAVARGATTRSLGGKTAPIPAPTRAEKTQALKAQRAQRTAKIQAASAAYKAQTTGRLQRTQRTAKIVNQPAPYPAGNVSPNIGGATVPAARQTISPATPRDYQRQNPPGGSRGFAGYGKPEDLNKPPRKTRAGAIPPQAPSPAPPPPLPPVKQRRTHAPGANTPRKRSMAADKSGKSKDIAAKKIAADEMRAAGGTSNVPRIAKYANMTPDQFTALPVSERRDIANAYAAEQARKVGTKKTRSPRASDIIGRGTKGRPVVREEFDRITRLIARRNKP